jgi:putative transposase
VPATALRTATVADAEAAEAMPDLVKRDFTAAGPGIKFVGDITYVHTWQRFIDLAKVIDCYSEKVLGWAIEDHMRSELVERALSIAPQRPGSSPTRSGIPTEGLGHRAGHAFIHEETGICWDDSEAETFFSALKTSVYIARRTP